ncbi:MAG: GxxExxY protein [bacterium]|nr:GxxExxY protein [bacterium]MDD5529893.1 GxxExxY protein [bacterium]
MTQKSEEFLYKELTEKIIGAAFEVYKNLGYGFLEKVYKNALLIELRLIGIEAKSEFSISVHYKGEPVGDFACDIYVEEKVLVELKVDKEYNSKNESQLLNYLKATNVKVGLLLNFGEKKCEVKRMVY